MVRFAVLGNIFVVSILGRSVGLTVIVFRFSCQ